MENVPWDIRNFIGIIRAIASVWRRVLLMGHLDFGICTRKENEAQKEDPGEEFRNPGLDDQEPPLAAPLLRIGHLRTRLSWCSRDCGIDRLLLFLCRKVRVAVSVGKSDYQKGREESIQYHCQTQRDLCDDDWCESGCFIRTG